MNTKNTYTIKPGNNNLVAFIIVCMLALGNLTLVVFWIWFANGNNYISLVINIAGALCGMLGLLPFTQVKEIPLTEAEILKQR